MEEFKKWKKDIKKIKKCIKAAYECDGKDRKKISALFVECDILCDKYKHMIPIVMLKELYVYMSSKIKEVLGDEYASFCVYKNKYFKSEIEMFYDYCRRLPLDNLKVVNEWDGYK